MTSADLMKKSGMSTDHLVEFPIDKTSAETRSYGCLKFSLESLKEGICQLNRGETLRVFSTFISRYSGTASSVFHVWDNDEWKVYTGEYDEDTQVSEQIIGCPEINSRAQGITVAIAFKPVSDKDLINYSVDFLVDVSVTSEVSVVFNREKFLVQAVQHRGQAFIALLDSVLLNRELPANEHCVSTTLDTDFFANLSQPGSGQPYELDTPVFMAFRRQVQRSPEAEATRFQNRVITYQQLDDQSSQLAHYLKGQGAHCGSSIGIYLHRSDKAVVAMLAAQKLGAIYIPLDPSYPADRIDYIAEDSGLRLLISEKSLAHQISLAGLEMVLLDEAAEEINTFPCDLPEASIDGNSRIYSIYTSGSTGKPKGVGVRHRNVSLYLHSQNDVLGIENNKRVLALASFCFDVSTAEIYCTLISGGCVVIATRDDATNPVALAQLIKNQNISLMHATPSSWRLLLESGWQGHDLLAITAGEPFPRELIKPLTGLTRELWNFYGPTETTVYATCYRISSTDDFVHIGTPMPGYKVEVRDKNGMATPLSATGELCIGGPGVVDGYVNRTDLNLVQFTGTGAERYYRTGDAVRLHANGFIEYFSRLDGQVKVNGYRIELGEIEAILSEHPAIQRGVAGVQTEGFEKQLVTWYVAHANGTVDPAELKQFLGAHLPPYMIPTLWEEVGEIPLNPNGKVDRNSLPKIESAAEKMSNTPTAPLLKTAEHLQRLATDLWLEILDITNPDNAVSFFAAGGTSMLALNYINRLNQQAGTKLSIVDLFSHTTLGEWREFIAREFTFQPATKDKEQRARQRGAGKDIAIIGMSVHVPGANSLSDFWHNIVNGRESISHFSAEELVLELPESAARSSSYVPYRGILEDYDAFDDQFFGMTPKEAKVTDPQHRLFLQSAWHALEDSGHVPSRSSELVGVYAGNYYNTYHVNNVSAHQDVVNSIGHLQEMIASEKDYIATRVAHKLNLKGPAISVHTACSTSLVAISQACLGLNGHQCDVALAGAASLTTPVKSGHDFQEDGVFSQDGHTRTFSSLATGTTFSDGVGAVVLKRLDDAIANGDRIYAVIKAASVNNDGGGKMSFMAPSSEGQAAVIEMAIRESGVPADSIGYVEAHGTATPVGDPIEVEGLRRAFEKFTDKKQFCAIGSVKSNLGHLTAAAGVLGVIKTALSIHNKEIPPSLNAEPINSAIKFEDSPFYPQTKRTPWANTGYLRRAGVSSFGVGGTNAHAILEEYVAPEIAEPEVNGPELLLMSAKSKNALDRVTENLSAHLAKEKVSVGHLAHTLTYGRHVFDERRFVVTAKCPRQVASRLDKLHSSYSGSSTTSSAAGKVAFMFPGQGCQYAGMAAELYESELEFRQAVDLCADILTPIVQLDLRQLLLAKGSDLATATDLINQTRYSQPCLFVMGYALYKLWASWGITPDAVIGHSVGELVAAHIAGVFSLEDALLLVASRGSLMQSMPPGAMVSVRLAAEAVEPLLTDELSIAAINGATACVVAGTYTQIEQFTERCEQQGVVLKRLHTSHAFHSEMMEPAVEPFSAIVDTASRSHPVIPIMSTANASWLSDEDAIDAKYWGKHLRQPVRFAEGVQALWREGDYILLELGPRSTASTLAMQQVKNRKKQVAIPSLQFTLECDSELEALYVAAGRLWVLGVPIDLSAFRANRPGKHVSLPCYPFEKNRYWLESGFTMDRTVKPSSENPALGKSELSASVLRSQSAADVRFQLKEIFSRSTDRELSSEESFVSFIALGLDSLALIQFSNAVRTAFAFRPSMRQLMGELETIELLANHIEAHHLKLFSTQIPDGKSSRAHHANKEYFRDSSVSATQQTDARHQLKAIFQQSTERVLNDTEVSLSFMALGMDSLALIQFSNAVRDVFSFRPSMRQLMGELENLELLANYIDVNHPTMTDATKEISSISVESIASEYPPETATVATDKVLTESAESEIEDTLRAQLELIQQQLNIANQQFEVLSKLRKARNAIVPETDKREQSTDGSFSPDSIYALAELREQQDSTSKGESEDVGEASIGVKSLLGIRYRMKIGDNNIPAWESRDDGSDRSFEKLVAL